MRLIYQTGIPEFKIRKNVNLITVVLILTAIIYLPYNKFYLYSLVLVSIENIVVPIIVFILFLFERKKSTLIVYSVFVDIIKKK